MNEKAPSPYFDKLISLLGKHPLITKVEQKKRVISRNLAYLKVSVVFVDGSALELSELVDAQLHKIRYAYHYQDAYGKPVFRHDNAPHHPELANFPDHKHIGNIVQPSHTPTLAKILEEISRLLRR